jgi:hypothetical protein
MNNGYRRLSYGSLTLLLIALIFYVITVKINLLNFQPKPELAENVLLENQPVSVHANIGTNQPNRAKTIDTTASDFSKLPSEKHLNKEPLTLAGTKADAAILQSWGESRGRFTKETLTDYASYDLDTLMTLSDAGDIKAMTALARLYSSPGYSSKYGLDYSIPLYYKAAVYGSSYAFERLAIAFEVKQHASFTMEDHIEILAIKNVAALRGDYYPNFDGYSYLKRHKITLSPADITAIKTKSEALYQQLLSERRQLGLGDFDNSVPSPVKNFFSALDDKIIKY